MRISLIIATFNRAQSLLRTLESVARQTLDSSQWECIVVNNNSSDSTQEDVQRFISEHQGLNFRLIECPKQGLSRARNAGINEAQSDILAFVDDDETVVEKFLEEYVKFFDRGLAIAAGGQVIPKYESERPKWMSRITEQMIANPIQFGPVTMPFPLKKVPAGGNMAFRKEFFNMYGGFEKKLGRKGNVLSGGEETEIFEKLADIGERIYYVPGAIIYHHISDDKLTLDYFDRLSEGVGLSKILRSKYHTDIERLKKAERNKRRIASLLKIIYTIRAKREKGEMLIRMRDGIERGIERGLQNLK